MWNCSLEENQRPTLLLCIATSAYWINSASPTTWSTQPAAATPAQMKVS